jgi:hypothetical protein
VTEHDSNPNRWHPDHVPDHTVEQPPTTAPGGSTRRWPAWLTSGRLLLAAAAAGTDTSFVLPGGRA